MDLCGLRHRDVLELKTPAQRWCRNIKGRVTQCDYATLGMSAVGEYENPLDLR